MDKISLMYHCVYDKIELITGFQNKGAFQYKLNVDIFEKQVKYIDELCQLHKINRDDIEFTFDDGGISFYQVIAPILEKYGFVGIFFISTKYIGTNGFLSEKQIKELDKRGHIIGSHSHSHRNMTHISNDAIDYEWSTSIDILSRICNKSITYASIPFGFGSNYVYKSAKKYGLKKLYTSKPTTKMKNIDGVNIIGRYGVHNPTSVKYVDLVINSKPFRYKKLIRYDLLMTAKLLFGDNYGRIKSFFIKTKS